MNKPLPIISHSKPWITKGDLAATAKVLSSGMIAQGRKTRLLENMVANYHGAAGGIAVGSGTAALALALHGIGVKSSDEVIIPTYTCKSVLDAVVSVGATPVLCDIGKDWILTSETIAPQIKKKTAAIVAVHTFGISVDIPEISGLGLPVIEDCCQAFGKSDDRPPLGLNGSMAVFSFHATKCFTTGEGGMVISNNIELNQKMKEIRDDTIYCQSRLTAPMSDLQAALGISQLKRYNSFLRRRQQIANRYLTELKNCKIGLPDQLNRHSIFFRFPVRIKNEFNEIRSHFRKFGIIVCRGVDQLLHRQLKQECSNFPTAEKVFDETLSLPIYPALTDNEQTTVIRASQQLWS